MVIKPRNTYADVFKHLLQISLNHKVISFSMLEDKISLETNLWFANADFVRAPRYLCLNAIIGCFSCFFIYFFLQLLIWRQSVKLILNFWKVLYLMKARESVLHEVKKINFNSNQQKSIKSFIKRITYFKHISQKIKWT